MAKNNEDQEGMVFIGCLMVGVGVGLLVSAITDNWLFMAPCTVIGLGIGFIAMSFAKKK